MVVFSYFTLEAPAKGLYKEKGSKFMSFAYPVASEEEVRERLEGLKKKYFDAKHHCYAYVLGHPENIYRAFDAGEPNHSAGNPILGRIRSKNLENVLVVVVRYLGGVKLGVGGLVQSYKAAAEEALGKAVIIEKEITETFRITYDYAASPEVMRLVKDFDLRILQQGFTDSGSIEVEVKLRNKDKFIGKSELLQVLKISLKLEKLPV